MKFLEALFDLVFEILEHSIKAVTRGIEWLIGQKPQSLYSAKFISPKKLLSKRNKGFCLTGTLNLSLELSFRNCLTIGGTGTGKSSTILLPSLYSMQGSFVVHDISGELYEKSARYLELKGYTLKVLNFSSLTSDGFNPLSRANTTSEINKAASLLIRTTLGHTTSDPFWNLQATTLLGLIIHLVKTQKKKYQNFAGVRYFLSVLRINPDEMESYIKRLPKQQLQTEYQAFLSLEEKVKAGVVATCLSALQIFTDETVARVTAFDSIDFSSLRKKPTAIFIQNPVADQSYYTAISSLFLEQLFAELLQQLPKKQDQSVFALIDEAASLYLPSLATAVANVRKYRTGLLLALQDFNQLIHVYGKEQAETIKANCFAKLYFTGQSYQTAAELEHMLGQQVYTDERGLEYIRPLITKDELRTLDTRRALLVCGNHQPMVTRLIPYYQQAWFLKLSKLKPRRRTKLAPAFSLPEIYHLPTLPKTKP